MFTVIYTMLHAEPIEGISFMDIAPHRIVLYRMVWTERFRNQFLSTILTVKRER